MEMNEFIANFAEQFEDTDASEITAATEFKALDEWLKVRNRFPKEGSNVQKAMKIKYKENTAIMIDSLAKCIADSQAEG